MNSLKYTIIKNEKQYNDYCNTLEDLIVQEDKVLYEEIDLLNLLIKNWDEEHNSFEDLNPIELLKVLMKENNLKPKDLIEILDLSKGTISKILNRHKGLSKGTIRKLSYYFKVSQEAFNRPYKLINEVNRSFPNASLMNTKKDLGDVIVA